MKPVKSRKPVAFKRDAPDLPAELDSSVACLQDLDRTNQQLETLRLEDSVLERVHLAGGQFGSAIWKDVRLVACDLANVRAHRISLVRVELIDCRLTGFRNELFHHNNRFGWFSNIGGIRFGSDLQYGRFNHDRDYSF